MFNQLNGWQRIGVVITGLWLAFVVILGINSLLGKGVFGTEIAATYKSVHTDVVCSNPTPRATPKQPAPASSDTLDTLSEVRSPDDCAAGSIMVRPASDKTIQIAAERHVFSFGPFFVALFVPPILLWLLSYASVAVFKWVARGFHRGAT